MNFSRCSRLPAIAAALAVMFEMQPARAEPPARRFVVHSWQSEDGLPGNVVRAVAQAADGWLWVATAEGTVRFDGIRFSSFAEDSDALLAQRPPRALFALSNGDVWIATMRGGLLRWNGRRLRAVWEDADPSMPTSGIVPVSQVVEDGGAGVFIGRGGEVFAAIGGATPQKTSVAPHLAAKLQQAAGAQAQRSSTAPAGANLELHDRRGRHWTATPAGGLVVSEGPGQIEAVGLTEFGAGSRITGMLEDREGSLWLTTGSSGLLQICPRRVQVLGTTEGLRDRTVFALLEDQSGALWAANKGGGIDRILDERVTHFEVGDGGANRPVSALCEDRAGMLWAATRNGSVFQLRDGAFRNATSSTLPVSKVTAMVEDSEGRLWLGGQQGLACWADGILTRPDPAEGFGLHEVTALAVDAANALWVGTAEGSVFRGSAGHFQQTAAGGDLRGRTVSSLLPDADGSIWITTLGAGLFRWKDQRIARFSQNQGLSEARLTCVLDDRAGHLYLGSLAGIFRVAKSQLTDIAEDRQSPAEWLMLDRSDGLLSRECTGGFQPAGWRSRTGVLCFPTVHGIAKIDPAALNLNPVAPVVVIEEARANNGTALRDSTLLRAGPGRSRLEFRYTALSFVAPEKVRFRHLLEGLEGNSWIDVGGQRTAAFESVPPGRYRFRVRAANADGIWSNVDASFAVEVLPHVWETIWFRTALTALSAALAIGIGWGIARARMRGRLMRLQLQTSRETERARIAQDLHDDLGASLTEISLLAQLAAEEDSRPRGRDALPEIAAKARGLVGALDEIVWAVNPRHDTLASLADYLAAFAAEFLEAAGIALRLDIPRDLPATPLDAEQRHGLFLAVREALNNAAKHSGASELWLRLSMPAGELKISVDDNGHGLSEEAGASSEGLRNIRARMTRIGGECRIESNSAGTSVCFSLPLARR